MTLRNALALAAARFAFSPTARLDAELLLAHALGITRDALLIDADRYTVPAGFAALVERRAAHEPVAYIIGTRGFWTIELAVGPGVLIPRADSETLIEAAIEHFGNAGPANVLDLGTGSGALLLAALDQWPNARGVGVDRSPEALAIAHRNVTRLGMEARARIVEGDWTGCGGTYDLILCNPPYVADDEPLPREVTAYEPASALFAGADGLDDYRLIAPLLRSRLASGGVACIEIGHRQAVSAGALFAGQGLSVTMRRDLGGRERCLVVTP